MSATAAQVRRQTKKLRHAAARAERSVVVCDECGLPQVEPRSLAEWEAEEMLPGDVVNLETLAAPCVYGCGCDSGAYA